MIFQILTYKTKNKVALQNLTSRYMSHMSVLSIHPFQEYNFQAMPELQKKDMSVTVQYPFSAYGWLNFQSTTTSFQNDGKYGSVCVVIIDFTPQWCMLHVHRANIRNGLEMSQCHSMYRFRPISTNISCHGGNKGQHIFSTRPISKNIPAFWNFKIEGNGKTL